jgi:ketoreductase RED2
MGDLDGKVALVTGSSSGIGAETARALSDAGARVAVNSNKSVTHGQLVAARLPGAVYVQGDVADPDDANRIVRETLEKLGRLDILVNNAGTTVVIPHHDLQSATPEIWRSIFDVNVIGTWQVTVAATDALRDSADGCVINVSSMAGQRATGSSIPYACSKAAVSHMTRLLANTLAPEIRVNAVAPGLVDTPWTADWNTVREYFEATTPLRRCGEPEDIAQLILGLVRSRYTTGEVVLADGGMHLR